MHRTAESIRKYKTKKNIIMKTQKANIVMVEVKVVDIMLNLGELKNYMSMFLALKNHERNTDDILEVRGFDGSNIVNVVIIGADEDEDENEYVERCKDFVEQFGKIVSCEIHSAWTINRQDLNSVANHDDWYIY